MGAHALEHAGEDAVEHVAAHEAEDAAAHAGEHGAEDGAACALSFAAATLVATPGGEQPIAQVKPGDSVSAYDPAAGKRSMQTVATTSVHQDANLVDVTLLVVVPVVSAHAATLAKVDASTHGTTEHGTTSSAATKAAATGATTTTRDESIRTTSNHPWLTADAGWLPAGFLRVGKPVRELDGAVCGWGLWIGGRSLRPASPCSWKRFLYS